MATAAKKQETINLIDIFSEFKDFKRIDKQTFINVLEDSFRNVIATMYGTDANYDVIKNPDAAIVWTAEATENGWYLKDAEGRKLSIPSGSRGLVLDGADPEWALSAAEVENCVNLKSTTRTGSRGPLPENSAGSRMLPRGTPSSVSPSSRMRSLMMARVSFRRRPS